MRLAMLLLSSSLLGFPQSLPKGLDLLNQCSDAFTKLHSYQYEVVTADPNAKGNTNMTTTVSVAAVKPDKRRTETKSLVGTLTVISDGDYTWSYSSMLNQYTKRAAVDSRQSFPSLPGIDDISNLIKMLKEVKTIRDETLELDGREFSCWMVESKLDILPISQLQGMQLSDGIMRFWIAKDLKIPVQSIISGTMNPGILPIGMVLPVAVKINLTTTIHSLKLDPDLPDSLFRFTPPEGAKEVAKLLSSSSSEPSLIGRPAPAFHVRSLNGRIYDLSDLKGKVVLLDFWATWCSPCRKEMADLDELEKEYGGTGLVLLGLDLGEDPEVVEKYVKSTGVSHTIALTTETDLASAYQIRALPTHVVIGQDGVVVDYQIGKEGPDGLRSFMAKAGLKPGKGKNR